MQTKTITYAILAICWEEFLTHMTGANSINLGVNIEEQSITTFYEDTDHTATPSGARDYLILWITKSLHKYGKVVLYTCRDNAIISIENPDEAPLDSLDSSGMPELEGILFIAYD